MYNFVASLCTAASSPPLTKKIRVYYRYDRKVQNIKQLLDEVEHNIMNYQNRGLCYRLRQIIQTRGFDNS